MGWFREWRDWVKYKQERRESEFEEEIARVIKNYPQIFNDGGVVSEVIRRVRKHDRKSL